MRFTFFILLFAFLLRLSAQVNQAHLKGTTGNVQDQISARQIWVPTADAFRTEQVGVVQVTARTLGFWTPGDGGAATFRWVPGDSTATNLFSVIAGTGTGRWILQPEGGPIDVRAAGIVVNDGINDAPRFAALMQWVEARGGGVISLPPGTIDFGARVAPEDNVTIAGSGIGVSIIRSTAAEDGILVNSAATGYLSTSASFTLRNLTLQGTGATATGGAKGPATRNLLAQPSSGRVARVTLENVESLWSLDMSLSASADHAQVTGCRIRFSRRDAINLSGCRSTVITGNIIDGCGDDAIAVHVPSNIDGQVAGFRHVCQGNLVVDSYAIKYLGGRRLSIIGNTIQRGRGYGIYISPDADSNEGFASQEDVVVEGNILTDIINPANVGYSNSVNFGIYIAGLPVAPASSSQVAFTASSVSGSIVIGDAVQNSEGTIQGVLEYWLGSASYGRMRVTAGTVANGSVLTNGSGASLTVSANIGAIPAAPPGDFRIPSGGMSRPWQTTNWLVGTGYPQQRPTRFRIANNILSKTLPDVSDYTNWGFGQTFTALGLQTGRGVTNFQSGTGIRLDVAGGQEIDVVGNHVFGWGRGLEFGVIERSAERFATRVRNIRVTGNTFQHLATYGIERSVANSSAPFDLTGFEVRGNLFDIDPYFASADHAGNGEWLNPTTGNSFAMHLPSCRGGVFDGNTFANLKGAFMSQPSGTVFVGNVFRCEPANGSSNHRGVERILDAPSQIIVEEASLPSTVSVLFSSVGSGLSAGNLLVNATTNVAVVVSYGGTGGYTRLAYISGTPAASQAYTHASGTYTITATEDSAVQYYGQPILGRDFRSQIASAQPTSGWWPQGVLVRNSLIASGANLLIGWVRLTTGTGHTGSDWSPVYAANATFTVP